MVSKKTKFRICGATAVHVLLSITAISLQDIPAFVIPLFGAVVVTFFTIVWFCSDAILEASTVGR